MRVLLLVLVRRRLLLISAGAMLVVLAAGLPAVAAASRGPVAAYSFDEGEGEVAHDATGNGHEGTVEGATWTTHGKYGGALEFDGEEGEQVTIPDANDLDLTDELTLEAWVRPTEAIEWSGIITKKRGSEISYQLAAHADHNAPVGYVANAEKEWGVDGGTTPLPSKTWSHIVFTSDGSRLRFYVNGHLKGSDSSIDAEASTGPLLIGGETFKGKIDEVRVYDRALDEGEITTDLNTGIETPPSGPVAAYAFDENEGTIAHDFAGGHDGTIEGATWTKGKFGGGLEFDATEGDVVTIPDAEDLDTEEFTLEAWIRPNEDNFYGPIVAHTPAEGQGYALFSGSEEEGFEGWLTGFISDHQWTNAHTFSEEKAAAGAWTHVAVTNDGNRIKLYVNGELVDDRASEPFPPGEAPLQIGGDEPFAEGNFFDGKIDEVRVYNRALSEGEVDSDMHTGIETPQAGPVAAYSFDEGEGSTVEDLTGNGHTGTLEGATWTTHGKYGGALEFDGENDCVAIPESAELQFLEDEEFTLEAWVKPENGEEIQAILTQEDNSAAETEEPFAYSMLVGGEEPPKGWLRKGGESGHVGVSGAEEPLSPNTWSHIAFTDDGATLRFYVNGELIGEETAIPLTAAKGPVTIGCLSNYGNFFEGRIDELRIYNQVVPVTPESIAAMNELPACEGPSGQQVVESRKELKDGGYATVYSFEGMTAELPSPPSGFDPLTASAEELEEYGFPPRPTDPEALAEWEADMSHFKSAPSGSEGLCKSDLETETTPEGTMETGEGEGEEAKFWTSLNWAGYVSVDRPHPSRWVAMEGNYTQPKSHPDACTTSDEVSWIGLGGYESKSLIQAGTGIDSGNHYYAWFEWLGPKRTISIHRIKRLGIHPGDQIHVYLSYGQSTHRLNFYVANNTTEKAQPLVFHNFDGANFYDGSSAEWIDERPAINGVFSHLKNFAMVNWTGVRAQENDGTWAKVGNLPHRRLHMIAANNKQLAAPGFLQNEGRAFQDNWIRCHG